ncbi:cobalamin synthesis protein P47K [Pseudopedobacter saltans DSM 12145]|uniref:Cobalamin synthesis protein P47K n=1 Tax=Pseudopedobacter saltans (strain ATCC 51119 / DSM 12145 / JCM 21818 / CCUG 39354 / LMG 10337 / NBRC 100064 / NCIMB 13643) TaxID=762903 RepID=F0S8P8_PSESL|nr:GTP-binding protein [Pseudopedobacter saltans]ADY52379.1 cobalamin synthesis protein P47K [Pseudopedobacter saltans DSM 12145]
MKFVIEVIPYLCRMALKITPVTILTGFLGAGKTTFLNHIIKENPDTKFAIIENEFGQINIDSSLVINTDENIFELSNGCICCSVNGELSDLLNKLVTGPYEFDHLIIETTGIADPSAVAAVFMTDYNIQSVFKLDGVICLVDCVNVLDVLGVEEEASQQIAFADYIIYNKKDEADKDKIEEIKQKTTALNPFADFEFANYGKVETKKLLSLNAYDKATVRFKLGVPNSKGKEVVKIASESHHHDIVSQSFVFEQSFDLMKLRHYFTVMLMIQGAYFYRIKGIINIEGINRQLILQSVKGSPVFTDGDAWENDTKRETRLVFIGKNLRRDILEKGLRQCFYA